MAPSGPVKRPYRPKERKKRFLLYCEGLETEPSYFRGLMRFLRSTLVEIEIGEGQRDPKGLVELAKARREDARRAAKKEKDVSLLYDEVWCVFDVDRHTRLPDAIQQAAALSIDLAISNPCFELWLLIHFQEQWAYIDCDRAQSAVRKYMSGYEKVVDYSLISGRGAAAINRAVTMERRAMDAGDKIGNPTTAMWRLVSELCKHAGVTLGNV
jgi:hypothetical protein